MVKACIFDLDGVLVDTARYHYLAWKRLAKEMGFDFTEEDNERLKGVSRMRSLEILLDIGKINVSEKQKLELAERKNSWYVEYISKMNESEILPGVNDFLNLLRKSDIKIAVASASKNAKIIIEKTGLGKYLDILVDGTQIQNAKPDPEIFLKASQLLGVKPENCVVFEDSIAGIKAAKAAGMKCIGVGDSEKLWMADKVIPDFLGVDLKVLDFEGGV
ncbi:beta-phosphoglucomutase [Thermosipho ferrireducens]|uniref:beta-phosphoglucomutase n=1 Tax=Thermosipho ferrireducens TaxID=2571116 RepID=UPI001D1925B5|nr:beta-phosphoglucomutase [Thermosipho ferrireducens]